MSLETRIISVENLSKSYHIWSSPLARLQSPGYRSLAELPLLPTGWKKLLRRKSKESYREFFALHDVSFHVERGESLGIIGRNGSGKSTLLQIITGTLQPTAGQAEVRGRVAALLELGSGFNPEFTGRDNARLNATLHGLTPAEIDTRLEAMLAFADIGDFVDQPVKTYSSGMMLRLAFAVVAHIEADIMIIDEALAVGDAAFSRKCIACIERFQANGGTLLLVSHDPGSVLTLCEKAVLLERGELLQYGSPKLVTTQYLKLAFAPAERYEQTKAEVRAASEMEAASPVDGTAPPGAAADENGSAPKSDRTKPVSRASFAPGMVSQSVVRYASSGAAIQNPRVEDAEGREVNLLVRGDRYFYVYEVAFSKACYHVRCGMLIKTLNGLELGGAVSAASHEASLAFTSPGSVYEVRFAFTCYLLPGNYFLNAGVQGFVGGGVHYLHRVLDAYMFRVMDETSLLPTGIVDFRIEPQTRELSPDVSALAVL